jgi:serine phosphatase RsbU (regulator of sigma subunit)
MPLGTLWVFSDKGRDFSPQETNLVEIIAGRLAADLEREMLLVAGVQSKQDDRQLDAAARWLAGRLPSVAPLIEGYEVAGWTRHAREIGGTFHDWSVLPDGRLALAVGDAAGQLTEAGLGAASLHAAIKAHAGYRHSASEMLSRVNDTLYAASPGDQRAGLAYALIDPNRGQVELSLAGGVAAYLIGSSRKPFAEVKCPLLGEAPETNFRAEQASLRPGEALLLFSSGVLLAADFAAQMAVIGKHTTSPADELAGKLQQLLTKSEPPGDLTALVLKRRPNV